MRPLFRAQRDFFWLCFPRGREQNVKFPLCECLECGIRAHAAPLHPPSPAWLDFAREHAAERPQHPKGDTTEGSG